MIHEGIEDLIQERIYTIEFIDGFGRFISVALFKEKEMRDKSYNSLLSNVKKKYTKRPYPFKSNGFKEIEWDNVTINDYDREQFVFRFIHELRLDHDKYRYNTRMYIWTLGSWGVQFEPLYLADKDFLYLKKLLDPYMFMKHYADTAPEGFYYDMIGGKVVLCDKKQVRGFDVDDESWRILGYRNPHLP